MEQKKYWVQRHPIWTAIIVIIGLPMLISAIGDSTDVGSNINTPSNQSAVSAAPEPVKEKVVIPVEIISSKITEDSIGTPILHVTVKNNSKKTIDAMTIMTSFTNNYDEPVGKWGIKEKDYFAGLVQDEIAPNEIYSSEWNLAVYDTATKATGTEVYKVHFTDGETLQVE